MSVERTSDYGPAPAGAATRWKEEIRAFDKERADWIKRVGKIEARYRDEEKREERERRFSLLWANVEVLSPTLYAHDPKPEVSRRFKDRDPVGKVLGMVIERNLTVAMEEREGQFGRTMKAVVKDLLLGGQGTAWARYDVRFGAEPDGGDGGLAEGGPDDEAAEGEAPAAPPALYGGPAPIPAMGGAMPPAPMPGMAAPAAPPGMAPPDDEAAEPIPRPEYEAALLDYVHWRDWGHSAGARVWDEVGAVWRRSFLTRDALVKRFGPEKGARVPLDCKAKGDDEREETTLAKAMVYEVWDSDSRTVQWVHLGMDELLDEKPYTLEISGRFPCPAPLFGTMTNGSTIPVPDFAQYQDQAAELDELTGRIAALTKALRLVGFAPGDTADKLQQALDIEGEAQILPIAGWAAFGGNKLADMIVWLPIGEIITTLAKLQDLRERVKQDAYEITGLSDILRGSSQASETATAQQIKAQWGSVRVRQRQQDVQRFAAEALRLMAEIQVGHFDLERLLANANVQGMTAADQEQIPAVVQLLQGDATLINHRVDVETDSTVEADAAADRQAWSELLTGVASFMGAMLPVMQGVAQASPQAAGAMSAMVGEMLTSAVRRFRAGPAVEAAIEAAFEALGAAASQPPPPPAPPQPTPEEQAKAEAAQATAQAAQSRADAAHGANQVKAAAVQAEERRTAAEMAAQQDESAHRHADRAVEVQRLAHEITRPPEVRTPA